jgi:hypothetical protein
MIEGVGTLSNLSLNSVGKPPLDERQAFSLSMGSEWNNAETGISRCSTIPVQVR